MGWSVGFDSNWGRDVGYGVPSICDQPDCGAEIDRGLSYVCGGEPFGGSAGCGLYFCGNHLNWDLGGSDRWIDYADAGIDDDLYDELGQTEVQMCDRCVTRSDPFTPTPDTAEWTNHKMTDPSWAQWREENL